MYRSDVLLSYVRLAKLEKDSGAGKENYMQKAMEFCQQRKIKRTCSAEELRKEVEGIDAVAK
jgi:hypothetical protein